MKSSILEQSGGRGGDRLCPEEEEEEEVEEEDDDNDNGDDGDDDDDDDDDGDEGITGAGSPPRAGIKRNSFLA